MLLKIKITFWDAFFTTCSAFSNTGLVSHPTYKAWNMFGQSLIAIAALLGGFGLFALKIFLINVIFMKGHVSLRWCWISFIWKRPLWSFLKTSRMIIDSNDLLDGNFSISKHWFIILLLLCCSKNRTSTPKRGC